MLKAYSLDARIASIGSQLIDRVHQVAKNLENLPVYKNPHTINTEYIRKYGGVRLLNILIYFYEV